MQVGIRLTASAFSFFFFFLIKITIYILIKSVWQRGTRLLTSILINQILLVSEAPKLSGLGGLFSIQVQKP